MLLESLSKSLGLPMDYLEKISNSASYQYKTYLIAKSAGGFRTIDQPSRRLKAIQYQIKRSLLDLLPVHEAAMGYKRSKSILDNARPHAPSRYLLRMDLENFFPSIRASDLDLYIVKHSEYFDGYSLADLTALPRYLFKQGKLSIGAPTSPILSNILCYELDVALQTLSVAHGVTYTRYADDLFFSTTTPNILKEIEALAGNVIVGAKLPSGLTVNPGKTRHSSLKGCRRVTGIVLGSDHKVHVGRKYKRHIRSQIFRLHLLSLQEREMLAGKIAYVMSVEPAFINSLVLKYGSKRIDAARDPNLGETL